MSTRTLKNKGRGVRSCGKRGHDRGHDLGLSEDKVSKCLHL